MRALSMEMEKAGIMEEMVDDTMSMIEVCSSVNVFTVKTISEN